MTSGPLAHAPFRYLWAARTTSIIGTSLVSVAMVFAVIGLGGSGTDVGIVLAARVLPTGLLLLFGGVWADRFERLPMMIGADVLRGGVQLSIAALLFTGHASILVLACGNVVLGIGTAFFNPASTGLVPHTLPTELLQKGNSLVVMSSALADVISPVISALALGLWSPAVVFVADGVTFILSALALAQVRLPSAAKRADALDLGRDLIAGWRVMTHRPWLWANVVAGSGYFMLVVAPFYALGPVVSDQRFNGPISWSILAAALSGGILLGAVGAFTLDLRRPLAVGCLGLLLQALPIATFATGQSLQVVAVAQLLGGLGIGFYATVWDTLLQQHVPAEARSRVSAYDWAGSLLALPIGLALAGPLADAAGLATVFWAAAAAVFVIIIPLLCIPGVWEVSMKSEPITLAEVAGTPTAAAR